MAKAIVKQKPFEPITFTVTGTTYQYADLENFEIKPIKKQAILKGFRYTYKVESYDDQVKFQNRLAEKAADVADEYGSEHHIHLAMVKDSGHI